jgi:hypothetical protein
METLETTTTDSLDVVGKEWEESGEELLEGASESKDTLESIWDNLYNTILKPIWDKIVDAIDTFWEEHGKGLWENLVSFFTSVCDNVMTIWNEFLGPLINWIIDVLGPSISSAVGSIIDVLKDVFGIITDVISGVLKALGGLLDFITGIFSGDWNKAWEGIKQFFGGIWDAICGIVKGVVNIIIDILNALWSGLYTALAGIINGVGSIIEGIGELFGADWGWSVPTKAPQIPKLAKGGIVNSSTIAMIGEAGKEAVLPLENNTEWMDKLADKIADRNNTPSKIVLMLDGKELGWANINSINSITKQTGQLQLVF